MQKATLNALRTTAVSIASALACAAALAQPTVMEVQVADVTAAPFEAVMAEALSTPTAAGKTIVSSRTLVEAVMARQMVGMVP